MRIDIGDPKPWVDVEPIRPNPALEQFASGFAVTCKHCGGTSSAFLPYLEKHPDLIERFVAQHNRCLPRTEA